MSNHFIQDILKADNLKSRLKATTEDLASTMRLFGLDINKNSLDNVRSFDLQKFEIQKQIISQLSLLNELYLDFFKNEQKRCSVMNDESLPKLDRDTEIQILKNLLKRYELRIKEDDVLDSIKENDILEIYSREQFQIYRSWNFFSMCSYSIIDVLTMDWSILYERPKEVEQRIWALFPLLFGADSKTIHYSDFEINEHLLRERYLNHNRGVLIQMQLATPIINKNGESMACLTTSRATPIELGGGAKSLAFI